MSKITNPVVLIHWHKVPESECHIAITNGSTDFRDAEYMAVLGAGYTDEIMNAWSKTGYYMAAEIERLRQQLIAPLSIGELLQRLESQTGEKWSPEVAGDCNGKPLAITLPDTSSKAFWSGTGENETFHPETYRRWVKEAIERYCAIVGIEVKVK